MNWLHNSPRKSLRACLHQTFWRKIESSVCSERGSATLEFVVLAIPLFLPIFIYLSAFADVSDKEHMARVLARESARAFVASRTDSGAWIVANEVAQLGADKLGLNKSENNKIKVDINCSSSPCLSPNGRVAVTVEIGSSITGRKISATAQEYVSPWT